MSNLLEVRGVSKRFGGLVAVSDVSFTIAEGEILGLIGPNGAGKTTLFNVVNGSTRPIREASLLREKTSRAIRRTKWSTSAWREPTRS